jgi:hypothetical protein
VVFWFFKSSPSEVKRSEKTFISFRFEAKQSEKTFISFRFEAKQSEKMFISFRFEAKRKNRKRNEAKRNIFESETKRKYAVIISLWSDAKFFFVFSRERAKHMQNGSRFASFRFEAKHFFCETGAPYF